MSSHCDSKDGTSLTKHATVRMAHRSVSAAVIESVLDYGRAVYTRGALVHAIGRKEVERYRQQDIDLTDCEGVHVVCSLEGSVLTVYRSSNFRGLRPGLGRGRYRPDSNARRSMSAV